jgi:transposase
VRKIHAAPDPRLQPFAEQLTMIDQIGEDIARLKNRIESCRNAQINSLWQEDIARLKKREKLNSRLWSPRSASIPTLPRGSI